MEKRKKSAFLVRAYLILGTIFASVALFALLQIPSDPKNAVLGSYSIIRVMLVIIVLFPIISFVRIYIKILRNNSFDLKITENIRAMLSKRMFSGSFIALSILLSTAGLFFAYFLFSANSFFENKAILIRLSPIVFFLSLISLQNLIFLVILDETKIKSLTISFKKLKSMLTLRVNSLIKQLATVNNNNQTYATLKEIFFARRMESKVLLAILLGISLLLFINAFRHDPRIGYDASSHIAYIEILPERLPLKTETKEYFSPPLPYMIPAIVVKICQLTNQSKAVVISHLVHDCLTFGLKFGQLFNVFLGIAIILLLVQICEFIRPVNWMYKISCLTMLGVMPVYYRTFSQIRGEPYVVFFVVVTVYMLLRMLLSIDTFSWRGVVILGISLGLLILSRQWGLLVFPGFAGFLIPAFFQDIHMGKKVAKLIVGSFLIALVVGGWFYLHLFFSYGTFSAFNRDPEGFSFSNQPRSFYFSTGLEDWQLFNNPVRGSFPNQFVPIFYSDVWGDYWGFLVSINKDQKYNYVSNQDQIGPYLGKVNLISLFPSSIILLAWANGSAYLYRSFKKGLISNKFTNVFFSMIFLMVVFSFAGYFWFLISYPNLGKGDTIKAVYMLHALILLVLLSADFLEYLRLSKPKLYQIVLGSVLLAWIYNVPAMITRY